MTSPDTGKPSDESDEHGERAAHGPDPARPLPEPTKGLFDPRHLGPVPPTPSPDLPDTPEEPPEEEPEAETLKGTRPLPGAKVVDPRSINPDEMGPSS